MLSHFTLSNRIRVALLPGLSSSRYLSFSKRRAATAVVHGVRNRTSSDANFLQHVDKSIGKEEQWQGHAKYSGSLCIMRIVKL